MKFRPAFWPTVIFIPMFLTMIGLGIWQLQRLQWKEALIAQRAAGISAPAVTVPVDPEAARSLDFRHVVAQGEFLNDHELFLGSTNEGGESGYHVLTPLRLKDGSLILVDRGWISGTLKDPAKRAAGQIAGAVTVEGLLRLPPAGRPSWFVPDNRCDVNYWFYVDLPAMAACQKVDRLLPYYMDAGPAPNRGGWPKGGQSRVALPNDHLQYALTWFSLAAAFAVIYYLYHRQAEDSGKA